MVEAIWGSDPRFSAFSSVFLLGRALATSVSISASVSMGVSSMSPARRPGTGDIRGRKA